MYCPVCLNETLLVTNKGVVHVVINNKQLDNGRFLFNKEQESDDEILEKLEGKIEEYIKWYTRFQNQDPIHTVELASNSFYCIDGCKLENNFRFSVIGSLFDKADVKAILQRVCDKYQVLVEYK